MLSAFYFPALDVHMVACAVACSPQRFLLPSAGPRRWSRSKCTCQRVGWVERSDTHHMHTTDCANGSRPCNKRWVSRVLNPSYALRPIKKVSMQSRLIMARKIPSMIHFTCHVL